MLVRLFSLAMVAILTACAPAPSPDFPADPSVITTEQIDKSNARNVYDMINSMRPIWLRSRGQNTLDPSGAVSANTYAAVFVDGQRHGSIDSLRSMSLYEIKLVRFVSGSESTTRYGTGYPAGVIEVFRR